MAEEINCEIRNCNSSFDRIIVSRVGEEDVNLELSLTYNPNPRQVQVQVQVEGKGKDSKEVVVMAPAPAPTPNVEDDINEMLRLRECNRRIGRQRRRRTLPRQTTIQAPYPWATDRRAIIHDLNILRSRNIEKISGKVRCNRCAIEYQTELDLMENLSQLLKYFMENIDSMKRRAPEIWMTPALPTCKSCNEKGSIKPLISKKKKSINWLYLLLDQTLGCCTLEQLRYFCKYTENHRTGAKEFLLFKTYFTLCRQLVPHLFYDLSP